MHVDHALFGDERAGRLNIEIGIASDRNAVDELRMLMRDHRFQIYGDAGESLRDDFFVSTFVGIGQNFHKFRFFEKIQVKGRRADREIELLRQARHVIAVFADEPQHFSPQR